MPRSDQHTVAARVFRIVFVYLNFLSIKSYQTLRKNISDCYVPS